MQILTGYRVGLLLASILLGCLAPFAASAMRAASGSYAGNNTDNRSITGLGFQPDAVLIKADEEEEGFLRFSTMSGDESGSLSDKKYKTNRIQALETDGFQVGTADEVNESGTTYYWFAWQNTSGTSTTIRYTGNNADNRSITGVGFAPDAAFVKGDVNKNAHMRLSSMSGDRTVDFLESAGASNRIQALETDEFQVGTHDAVNQQNKTYDAAALKTETNSFAVGSYTGDGTDNRAITSAGFQPDVVLIKGDASTAGVFRSTAHSGDAASVLSQSVAANMIQRFVSTGFEVGTNSTVNQNRTTYYWMTWKHVPPPSHPRASPRGGPYTTTQAVTLSAETGTTIRYTMDGSAPTVTISGVPRPAHGERQYEPPRHCAQRWRECQHSTHRGVHHPRQPAGNHFCRHGQHRKPSLSVTRATKEISSADYEPTVSDKRASAPTAIILTTITAFLLGDWLVL